MISYKVLIILFFTINISHCEYSEDEIKKECKICAATLSLVGFEYKLPLINYNVGMQYAVSKDKSFTLESRLSNQLTEKNINELENEYGKSLLSDKRNDYIHAYYNEIISFYPKLTPISPRTFCEELLNKVNDFTRRIYNNIGRTVDFCEKIIRHKYCNVEYSNVILSYYTYLRKLDLQMKENDEKKKPKPLEEIIEKCKDMRSLIEVNNKLSFSRVLEDVNIMKSSSEYDEKRVIKIGPLEKYMTSDQILYHRQLLHFIDSNLTKMEIFDTQTWCNEHIPEFLNKLQLNV